MAAKEICFVARTFGPGRAQEGDIIWVGEPKTGIGLKEGNDFIWMIVDDSVLPDIQEIHGVTNKFRFNVSLLNVRASRLASFSLTRARNPNDYYQPFRNTNPVTGLHRESNTALLLPLPITDKEL